MGPDAVQFDAADLARQIESLSQYQLDTLPFGVILIDRDGTIVFYSQTETQQSGYGEIPIGSNCSRYRRAWRATISRAASSAPWTKARSISNSAGPGFRRSDARPAAARHLVEQQRHLDFHRAGRRGRSLG